MILTTIWSFIMPPVKLSLYFYKETESDINTIVVNDILKTKIIEITNEDLNKKNLKVSKS